MLNFPSVWGDLDFHRYPDPSDMRRSFIYQHFQVHADAWLVDVIAVDSVMAVHHHLLRRGGLALTHTGSIVRTDGQAFSLDELQGFLSILHLFLSFARGSYCGLTYLSAHDVGRNRVWEQWGTYKVEPWQRCYRLGLIPQQVMSFRRFLKGSGICLKIQPEARRYVKSCNGI